MTTALPIEEAIEQVAAAFARRLEVLVIAMRERVAAVKGASPSDDELAAIVRRCTARLAELEPVYVPFLREAARVKSPEIAAEVVEQWFAAATAEIRAGGAN